MKLLSITRNWKKKHDKILLLAKSKLNSTETLVPQALIDMEISPEELLGRKKIWEDEKQVKNVRPMKSRKLWELIVLISKK